eukprot:scaffold76989_cov102-Phaeocystis_antarctica.AAC.3
MSTPNYRSSASKSGLQPTLLPSTLRLPTSAQAYAQRVGSGMSTASAYRASESFGSCVRGSPVLASQSSTAFVRRSRGSPVPQLVRFSGTPRTAAAARFPRTEVEDDAAAGSDVAGGGGDDADLCRLPAASVRLSAGGRPRFFGGKPAGCQTRGDDSFR